jgi:hypothetical protein
MSFVVLTIKVKDATGADLVARQLLPSEMTVLTAFSDGRKAAQLPGDDQPTEVVDWTAFSDYEAALKFTQSIKA